MRATIPFLRRRTLAPRMRDAFAAFESAARRRPLSDQRLDAYRNVLEDFAAWAGPSRRLSDVAPEEAQVAQGLAKYLTRTKLLRMIELLDAYRRHCDYNVGVGSSLGGFAVEWERILAN